MLQEITFIQVEAWKDVVVLKKLLLKKFVIAITGFSKDEGENDSVLEMRYQLNSCYEVKPEFFKNVIWLGEDEMNKYYLEKKLGTRKESCVLDLFESYEDELRKKETLILVEKSIQKCKLW